MNTLTAPRKAILGSFFGTALEWYDFFLYGSVSILVFPHIFFPKGNPAAATLLSLSTFAVSFVVRPIGAAVFGHLGDRFGRRSALIVTLTLMGVATGLIGLVPSYSTWGTLAPVLLVVLRILQGLSAGGEWGGALLMAVENAPKRRRAFYGSLVQVASPVGLVLSNCALLAAGTLSDAAFQSWGWRIPFLAGGALGIVGLIVRLKVDESPEFRRLQATHRVAKVPVFEVVRRHPLQILLTAGSYIGAGTVFYGAIIFGPGIGTGSLGYTRNETLVLTLAFAGVMLVLFPAMGVLSDRVAAKKIVLFGLLGMVATISLWLALFATGSVSKTLIGLVLLAIPFSANFGPLATLFASAFSAEYRYSGVSLGYQLGTVAGGAVPPLIAVAIYAGTSSLQAVGAYFIAAVLLSVLCTAMLRPATDTSAAAPAVSPAMRHA